MLIRGENLSTPSKGVKMLKYFCDMCKEEVKGYKYDLKLKGTGIPCCFCLGYPNKDDTTKRLYGYITNISRLFDGLNTDLKTDREVFDIEFELIKEKE